MRPLEQIIGAYRRDAPLASASTIPAAWYTDPRVLDLELRTVFRRAWQPVGRLDQLRDPGDYFSCELPGGEPIVVVRGSDRVLRAFYNVCRHHAAAVAPAGRGSARQFRCPYHGWTYSLEGALKATPDFAGVCDFDRGAHGLVPLACATCETWVWVRPGGEGPPLDGFLGSNLRNRLRALGLERLHWMATRRYVLDCNWKVFVDNYLDGGYHVPHLHKGLDSVLDYSEYRIETGERFCLQSSPLTGDAAATPTREVRRGERAEYYWIYPNFMINCYAGVMDTNLVLPRGVGATEVIFDFYFDDVSDGARAANLASIEISEQIQDEDVAICASVQRGLRSGAYDSGRLSVRREGGEHLFHRLLYDELQAGLEPESRARDR